MAKVHSTVEAAEKAMWGPSAEAASLIALSRTASDDASVACLATSILERYLAAWDALSTELRRHGYPALLPRAKRGIGGVAPDAEPQREPSNPPARVPELRPVEVVAARPEKRS